MTIGQRAWQEICRMAEEEEISCWRECRNLGIARKAVYEWRHNNKNPNADSLQKLCLMGYDVVYILTGERAK